LPDDLRPPYRIQFDNARDPYAARNALGITSTGGGGGGNVSNSGTPTVGQYAKWVTATTIQGVAPATVLSDIGAQPAGNYQPLDTQLTALATVAGGVDQLPYFTSTSAAAQTTLTSFARTLIDDVDAATMRATLGVQVAGSYQPLDADLTSIASYGGTGGWLYRSAADTWSPVTIGTGLSFSGGALACTVSGGGDVFKALANTFTAQNCFTGFGVVIGHTAAVGYGLEVNGSSAAGTSATINQLRWSNDGTTTTSPKHYFDKSRGTTVGTHAAVVANDILGELYFRGSTGTIFGEAANIRVIANGAPIASAVPGAIQIFTTNAAGTPVLVAGLSPAFCNFIGNVSGAAGDAPTGYVGEYLASTIASGGALAAGAYTATASLSLPPGDWDVRGTVRVNGPAGSYMYINVYTAAASSSGSADNTQTGIFTGLGDCWTSVGPFRVNQSSTVTHYLNIYMGAAGTLGTAQITARRRH
jgi:hypothetical protein